MEDLGERPVWSMSGSEMLSTLDVLDAELARLQTYRLHVIAGLENVGHAQEIGAHDTARLLTFRYRLNSTDAHRDVRLARALPKYDTVSAALPEPSQTTSDPGADRPWLLRPAQAEAIVSALERVPATVPVEDITVAEQQLVNLAGHLSPAELRRAGKQIRDLLDTDGPEPDEHRAYARESLTMSDAENGVMFRGYLANENAELLRALIHANARPHKTVDGEPDPRRRDKRQADALTTTLTLAATATNHRTSAPTATTIAEGHPVSRDGSHRAEELFGSGSLADRVTEAGRSGRSGWVPGYGATANITVTIDLNDLKAATADATGQLVYGDDLSAAAIRRLACDANVIPLVLGTNSEPLDVGRAERLVNRAMRRALNARDRGCVVCAAPPVQCDAHHIQSWLDGGPTAVSNLVLLCRRHHIDLHAGHWTIRITNGVVHVSRPSWADPPQLRTLNRTHLSPTRQLAPGRPRLPDDAPKRFGKSPAGDDGHPASAPSASASGRPNASGGCTLPSRRPSRWTADSEKLKQAARFAVWSDRPSDHHATRNPSHRAATPATPATESPETAATESH